MRSARAGFGNPVASGQGVGFAEARQQSKGRIGQSVPIASTSGTGRGLFSGQLSAAPTLASTGLGSPFGTSATAVDSAPGIFLNNLGSVNGAAVKKAAPTPPYTITACIAAAGGGFCMLGWTDGTKEQFIYNDRSNGNILVQANTNHLTWNSTQATLTYRIFDNIMWWRIKDDGTNVSFWWSVDGTNFVQAYTVAKASGYLGAAGYSQIMAGFAGGTNAAGTILSWSVT